MKNKFHPDIKVLVVMFDCPDDNEWHDPYKRQYSGDIRYRRFYEWVQDKYPFLEVSDEGVGQGGCLEAVRINICLDGLPKNTNIDRLIDSMKAYYLQPLPSNARLKRLGSSSSYGRSSSYFKSYVELTDEELAEEKLAQES